MAAYQTLYSAAEIRSDVLHARSTLKMPDWLTRIQKRVL